MEFNFIDEFNKKIREKNIDWGISALIAPNGNLYSLGSDSKLISKIFEIISYSILQEIADEHGYILHPSESQTVYPDFTLMKNEEDEEKIAVDVKTTYRKFKRNGDTSRYTFTLGSYASFMRDGKKNISYPYSQYSKHYIIGFIYTRNKDASEGAVYNIDKLNEISMPYKDVEVFVQEKYKIAGEKPGTGDTENIGSYKTNRMDYLINGEGPFSELGIEIFEKYWSGYPKYRAVEKDYTNIDEFLVFMENKGEDISGSKHIYELWKKLH